MILSLPLSAIYRYPSVPQAKPAGDAGPVSNNVVITPLVTFRIRLLPVSAMYIFPEESKTISSGTFNSASIAYPGYKSPLNPAVPVPTTVVTVPPEVTCRIR